MKKKLTIGRHEWCGLPALKIDEIKAKIDTGAKTSALHAEQIKVVGKKVQFVMEVVTNHPESARKCELPLVEQKHVMSSNGQSELRCVVETLLKVGGLIIPIELTLTNRHLMRFNLLLGCQALNQFALIDPSKQYILGKPK